MEVDKPVTMTQRPETQTATDVTGTKIMINLGAVDLTGFPRDSPLLWRISSSHFLIAAVLVIILELIQFQ